MEFIHNENIRKMMQNGQINLCSNQWESKTYQVLNTLNSKKSGTWMMNGWCQISPWKTISPILGTNQGIWQIGQWISTLKSLTLRPQTFSATKVGGSSWSFYLGLSYFLVLSRTWWLLLWSPSIKDSTLLQMSLFQHCHSQT